MNKKITRRAVLGTAIAGLVAAPLVVRGFRSQKPNFPCPHRDNWVAALERFEVKVEDFVGPPTFDLQFSLKQGTEFKAEFLGSNSFQGQLVPSRTNVPNWFTTSDGIVVARLERGLTYFHVTASPVKTHLSQNPNEQSGGENFVFVFKEGMFDSIRLPNGNSKVASDCLKEPMSLPVASHDYFNLFCLDIPQRTQLRIGTRWTIPAGGIYQYDFPCEISKILVINGRPSVQIQSLIKQEDFRKNPVIDLLPDTRDYAEMKEALLASKVRENCTIYTYIDMETGLTVRRESHGKSETQVRNGAIEIATNLHIAQVTLST